MPVREYRAIATATRARLKRARLLYLRLVWPAVRDSADPRLSTWAVAKRMRAAGLYSALTCNEDASCGCVKWWYEMFGDGGGVRGRSTRPMFDWLDRHRLAYRMSTRDVKRWERELAKKMEPVPAELPWPDDYPGPFIIAYTITLGGPPRPQLVLRSE